MNMLVVILIVNVLPPLIIEFSFHIFSTTVGSTASWFTSFFQYKLASVLSQPFTVSRAITHLLCSFAISRVVFDVD